MSKKQRVARVLFLCHLPWLPASLLGVMSPCACFLVCIFHKFIIVVDSSLGRPIALHSLKMQCLSASGGHCQLIMAGPEPSLQSISC